MPFSLRPHQKPHAKALALALERGFAALDGSDTGTGKTFVALCLAKLFGVSPFVLCPFSVRQDWLRAAELVGVEIEVVNYEKARGQRRSVLTPCPRHPASRAPFLGPFRVRLSNSDWGREERAGTGSRWVWGQPYEFMIFDEVDRCGGDTSLQSKLLIAARRQAKYILCLSATAADDPRQLKALGYALRLFTLDGTKSGWRYWLLRHGCKPGVFGGFDFVREPAKQRAAMAKIHGEIFGSGRGARLRKADIPGFPRTVVDVRLVEDPSGKAGRLAQELAEAYEGRSHLALLTALRQKLELLKVPALLDFAEHYAKTSRVIVFVNYTATIHALQKGLTRIFKQETPAIYGENTEAERDDIKRRFQSNQSPALVCNSQAGGVGIGLHDPLGTVERTTLISPCYSARQTKQVLGRAPRDGGAFSQQFFVYFADTLEAEIAAALRNKLENQDAFNDALLNGVIPYDHHNHPARNPAAPRHCDPAQAASHFTKPLSL